MNPDQLFTHLKKLATSLSAKQLLGLGTVFVAVVTVVVASAYWIAEPDYALLVADMDGETASAVVGRLKDGNVKYQLTDGGRSVSVPVERLDELRLQFGSGGLPSAGRLGFEIFDRPAFGTTEFLEHVNYRRALEGELARTISTLAEVASARVHISMAKDSLFAEADQPAKASVVLRLKMNRPLAAATVKGIAGLVSASVESLRPESVTILDTTGRFLSRPSEESGAGLSTAHFERQQQIERDLSLRVASLLEPVVGDGRVRVNVSAVLNPNTTEETVEAFDPNAVIRSRQTTTESSATPSVSGGVAGARANQPASLSTSSATPPPGTATASTGTTGPASPAPSGAAPAATGSAPPVPATSPATPAGSPANTLSNAVAAMTGTGRSSEITNYEVSRTTRHTVTGQGQIARLSVAVIVDDERVVTRAADGTTSTSTKPWDAQELRRLQGLVAAAVGLDQQRGDQLTVENISFDAVPAEPDPAPAGFGAQFMDVARVYGPSAARGLGVVLIASFALFGILRPLARRATAIAATPALPAPSATAARLPTVSEMEGQFDAETGGGGQKRLPGLSKRVAKLASEEPEQLARIVRGWMAEDERA